MIFLVPNPFNEFLKENAFWFALSIALLIALILLISLIRNWKSKKKDVVLSDGDAFLKALGGKANIDSYQAKSSRLVLVLKEKSLLDEEALKALGILSIIKMSNKITLVIDGSAEEVKKLIDSF
ncbi:MAG: PTS transporter subunit EIIB [Bacilli bacterium]|jgi:phosphotransferase system IIB component|nr:PTS transporter subunit EIIB [Bacilli bacterium]MDD4005582.1 PTS transporter subunit EIIB [Bacilli bacterium]